jgi:hypothetical protein
LNILTDFVFPHAAVGVTSLFFNDAIAPPGTQLPALDIFDAMFALLWNEGIATVSSAGNRALVGGFQAQLDSAVPRAKGGTNSPHIVIGNCQYNNTRHPTSQYVDPNNAGILSAYHVGTDVDCAVPFPAGATAGNDLGWGVQPPGTSQATANTAGLIAYYMSRSDLTFLNGVNPSNIPMAVKSFVLAQANRE